MIKFNPIPCPCGCGKFIMKPVFHCQCSTVTAEERDELMAMQRDAKKYRELTSRKLIVRLRARKKLDEEHDDAS